MILTNKEFEMLVKKASGNKQLIGFALARVKNDPEGGLGFKDLQNCKEFLLNFGEKKAADFVANLITISRRGTISRVRKNKENLRDKQLLIHAAKKDGEVKFSLGDQVTERKTGKRGQVIDVDLEKKTYLVSLNPFQLKAFEEKELEATV